MRGKYSLLVRFRIKFKLKNECCVYSIYQDLIKTQLSMKTISVFLTMLFIAAGASAQIGVGTTTFNSTLDVRGSLSTGYRTYRMEKDKLNKKLQSPIKNTGNYLL